MFVNVYYHVVFVGSPINTKLKGYLVHKNHKSLRLQSSNKFFNDVGKESISAIAASWFWTKLEIFLFNALWLVK